MQFAEKGYRHKVKKFFCGNSRRNFADWSGVLRGVEDSFPLLMKPIVSVQCFFADSQGTRRTADNPSCVLKSRRTMLEATLRPGIRTACRQPSDKVPLNVPFHFREKLASSSFRKNNRARCNRIFTVSSDTSRTSAVSFVESCSMSRNTSANRYGVGSF